MFSIICDARKGEDLGISILAMADAKVTKGVFWTSDTTYQIKAFSTEEVANRVKSRLRHNNPRVVTTAKAEALIRHQAYQIKQVQREREHEAIMDGLEQGWDAHKDY